MNKLKTIFSNWHFARWVRLFLGVIIVIQGVSNTDWLLAVLGAAFGLMAVFNLGCAGGTCNVPINSKTKQQNETN